MTTEDVPPLLQGNCHCGAFRFSLHHSQLSKESVVKCACRLCRKKGCLWFPLSQSNGELVILRDEGLLKRYRGEEGEHQFCSICGTTVAGECSEGKKSVNVRCLRGVEVFELDSLPQTQGIDMVALQSPQLRASCHCGNVVLDVLQPLGKLDVKEDDCSICTRNAWLGIYPHSTQVSLPSDSLSQTTSYAYGRKFNSFPFCSTCGVCVFQTLLGPPASLVENLSEAGQKRVRNMLEIQPVNLRCLEGIDADSVQRTRQREGTDGYEKEVLGLGQ